MHIATLLQPVESTEQKKHHQTRKFAPEMNGNDIFGNMGIDVAGDVWLEECLAGSATALPGFIEVLEPWMLPASLGPVASVLNSGALLDIHRYHTRIYHTRISLVSSFWYHFGNVLILLFCELLCSFYAALSWWVPLSGVIHRIASYFD